MKATVISDGLNVHDRPNGTVINVLDHADPVDILDMTNATWWQVKPLPREGRMLRNLGRGGWVMSKFLKLAPQPAPQTLAPISAPPLAPPVDYPVEQQPVRYDDGLDDLPPWAPWVLCGLILFFFCLIIGAFYFGHQ
jgi:hypothetical protein